MNSKLQQIKPLDWEIVVADDIEDVIKSFALTITQKTTLSTYSGSLHWHLKKGKERGILEVTCWPETSRVWVEIADNRRNDWNLNMIEAFATQLAVAFQGQAVLKKD